MDYMKIAFTRVFNLFWFILPCAYAHDDGTGDMALQLDAPGLIPVLNGPQLADKFAVMGGRQYAF